MNRTATTEQISDLGDDLLPVSTTYKNFRYFFNQHLHIIPQSKSTSHLRKDFICIPINLDVLLTNQVPA